MRRHLHHLLHQAKFLVPLVALLAALAPMTSPATVAEARVNPSTGFASAAACLNSYETFAVTQHANNMYAAPSNAGSMPALSLVGPLGATSPATISSIGSVYGQAYDDGGASGRERLFVSAYTKRLVNYGPAGPGGVYVFTMNNGAWSLTGSFQAANLSVPRDRTADPRDNNTKVQVGRSSLGAMQISPDGTELFIMNVQLKRIEVFDLMAAGNPTYKRSIAIPLGTISGDARAQADLWPFALKFFPYKDAQGNTLLIVGVNDSATRGLGSQGPILSNIRDVVFQTPPRAYLLTHNLNTGSWGISLNQDLGNDPILATRTQGETQWDQTTRWDYPIKTWNHWREDWLAQSGNVVIHPQPMLTDIEFVTENIPAGSPSWAWPMMVLGFRDRTADLLFNAFDIPAGEATTTAHGDTLAYRLVNGAWAMQTVNRQNNAQLDPTRPYAWQANPSDFYNDDMHWFYQNNNGPTYPAHIENHMGGLATTLSSNTTVSSLGVNLASTTLQGGGGMQGIYYYDNRGASGGDKTAHYTNITLAANDASRTKVSNLGDLEVLCSYALVGGRVWNDANGDGIQGGAEGGIGNIALEVRRYSDSVALASLRTDSQGRYLFAVPPNTNFTIRINAAASDANAILGYRLTRQNVAGSNELNDSDAMQVGGAIPFFKPGQAPSTFTGVIAAPHRNSDNRVFDIGLTRQLPIGSVGDRVWMDANGNGVQNSGEVNYALSGVVTLQAVSSDPGVVTRTAPISNGAYTFSNVVPGTYRLIFPAPPTGFRVSPADQGGDDTLDSDPSTTTYTTADFVVNETQQWHWDYGVIGGYDLWATKVGTSIAPTGTQVDYQINYGNRGNSTAVGANVVDSLPNGLIFVSSTPPPSSVVGNQLTWNVGDLAAQPTGAAQGTIFVRASVAVPFNPSWQTSINVSNCATIGPNTLDLNTSNNTSCQPTTLQRPELYLFKSSSVSSAVIGDNFNYTLSYGNSGSAAAANAQIHDQLPAGIDFVAWVTNPGNACSHSAGVVTCNLGTLNGNTSGSVAFTVRSNPATINATSTSFVRQNTATLRPGNGTPSTTAWPGDDPLNNSGSTSTTITFPDPTVSIFINPAPTSSDPEKLPVGEWGSIDITYGNTGPGIARSGSFVVTYGELGIPGTMPAIPGAPAPCSINTTARTITCPLGDLPANSPILRTVKLPLRLPARPIDGAANSVTYAADSYAASVTISTKTFERPTEQAGNTRSDTTQVTRPNPRIPTVVGPSADEVIRMSWGSAYYVRVNYDNRYVARDYLTRAAANSVMVIRIPDETTLLTASPAPTRQDPADPKKYIWELGTLGPLQAGSIRVALRTNVPVNSPPLHLTADISTTTPGDDTSDNHGENDVTVVAPPREYPEIVGALQLAMHSTFDPLDGGASQTDGVHYAEQDTVAWPAGEVLDFSPRLTDFDLDPLPFPLEYRARILRWRVVGYEVNGRGYPATGADSRGQAGCRVGGSPFTGPDGKTTCAYPYIGADASPAGRTIGSFLPSRTLLEPQMAAQGHVYWTKPVAPPMRNDVYLFTVDPFEPVRLTVAVDVEIWTMNVCPDINIEPYVCGTPIEEPQPRREVRPIEQTFTVKLLVPRSVVGPGESQP